MDPETERHRLVDSLRRRTDVDDERVLDAIGSVPRHAFVPDHRAEEAYRDSPLLIGEGQTISAPHMVAIMTDLLDLEAGDEVLEIGTGCGYHAAVTAEVVGPEHVSSVEYRESLADAAEDRLDEAGYGDVSVRSGDGKAGWPDRAPFDRAYLTCAAPDFPDAVVEQVRPGGYLLAPIGTGRQVLVRSRRRADGSLERDEHGGVRFVRLQ